MSERDKLIEQERKGVLELLLKKNGLTRKQLVDSLVGVWVASWVESVQFILAKKQKCRIVVTNNYKDYRMMPGIQVFRPTEVRRLPR